jgi:outer membrane receptor protein involved in Fe transport
MINTTRLLATTSLACTGMLAAMPASALAQEAGATHDDTDIVVTATRREARTIDIPYNISAVGGDRIDANQTRDQAELLRSIPGVAVVDRGRRNAGVMNTVTIRGVNVDSAALGDYAVSGVSPVSTYVGDTPLFAAYLLKDLDRVEVLRGPQGTLYGSGALGGTVRYILNKPVLGRFEGRATGGLSSVKGSGSIGYEADLILNVPLGETFAIRAVGSRQHYPGLTDYVNVYKLDAGGLPTAPAGVLADDAEYESVKDADFVHVWYGRVSALWQPSDAFDVTLTYNHQEDKVGGRRQITRGLDGYGKAYQGYQNGSIQREPSNRDVDSVALEANVDLGFATLTSSSSWYEHEGDSVSENTGFYAQNGWLAFYYNYPRPMASAVRSYRDKSFVQELRLVSKGGGAIDYVIGGYYQDQKLFSSQDSYVHGFKRYVDALYGYPVPWVLSDNDFQYRRHERFKDHAIFGELTWHITDTIDVTGGGRYFWNKSRSRTFMDLPAWSSTTNPTDTRFDVDDDKLLFKGNLSWKFADRGLLYATVSQGYRRGGSNAVPLTGNFAEDPGWQHYKSDSLINYEIGVKGSAGGLTYNLDAFYIDWKDIQLNTASTNWGFYVVQNGGKAKSQGIEAQVEGRSGGLRYALGYTFVDAKLTRDFYTPEAVPALRGRKGDRLPGSARHILTASADYRFDLGSDTSLTLRGDGFYQSSTRNAIGTSPVFNVRLPGFSIWNGSATLRKGNVGLTLFVKNLFDVDGVTGVFTEAYMGTRPSEGYYGNGAKDLITLPRTIGLSADIRF